MLYKCSICGELFEVKHTEDAGQCFIVRCPKCDSVDTKELRLGPIGVVGVGGGSG